MKKKEKIRYVWDYYKLPLAVICIILYAAGYMIFSGAARKETVLYQALVNVSAGESLTGQLDGGFLDYLKEDASEKKVQMYTGLYLKEDGSDPYHEYTYASRMKILAAISARQLDVVLMNKEAFDAFSQNGYLCDLGELFAEKDADLYREAAPYLEDNTVILEDNAADVQLDSSVEYHAVTEERAVGLDISSVGLIAGAGFEDTVYLGIIENSGNKDTALDYVRYLLCL